MTEDEMIGWHHRLNGHEFEQALRDGKRQGCLACCSSWCCKESDMTEQLNNKSSRDQAVCWLCVEAVEKYPLVPCASATSMEVSQVLCLILYSHCYRTKSPSLPFVLRAAIARYIDWVTETAHVIFSYFWEAGNPELRCQGWFPVSSLLLAGTQ